MHFHKQALLLHSCADENGRYALAHAYLTELGLVTTDGRRLSVAPPVTIDDQITDTSACFRMIPLQDPAVKDWLKRVPNKGECLVRITCTNPEAADGEGEIVFSNAALADLVINEPEGAWPEYQSVLPDLSNQKEWCCVGFDPDYMIEILQMFKKVAPVYGKFGPEHQAARLLIHRDASGDTGMFLDVAGGMWALLMPIDVETPWSAEANNQPVYHHPVRELQETGNVDFEAHQTPLPEDYFDPGQDDDETIFDDEPDGEADPDSDDPDDEFEGDSDVNPQWDHDDDTPGDFEPDHESAEDTELTTVEAYDPDEVIDDPALVQARLNRRRF